MDLRCNIDNPSESSSEEVLKQVREIARCGDLACVKRAVAHLGDADGQWVLVGAVDGSGDTFRLTLRLFDTIHGGPPLTLTSEQETKAGLVAAATRLVRQLPFAKALNGSVEACAFNAACPSVEPYGRGVVRRVVASSVLTGAKGAYAAKNVLDGAAATAWCEGKGDDGVGETLTFDFARPTEVGVVMIMPCYGKSTELCRANNRVRAFTLYFDDQPVAFEISDPFLFDASEGEGEPALEPETFMLQVRPVPTVKRIRMRIDAVERGAKYRDTCVSEVQFGPRFD